MFRIKSMYSPFYNLNSSLQLYKLSGTNYLFNKGLEVTTKETWQGLLLNVSQTKCRQSFRKIFDHFYPLLVGQGLKNGLSKEVSSELAQETMLKVWAQANTFDGKKGNVSVWIFTISRNLRFDYFRSNKNNPLNIKSENLYQFDNIIESDDVDLDIVIDINLLRKHIVDLPFEQKDIIEKIYFDGFTQDEISKTQSIPLGTVKSRVRLALTSIKEKMGGEIK